MIDDSEVREGRRSRGQDESEPGSVTLPQPSPKLRAASAVCKQSRELVATLQ